MGARLAMFLTAAAVLLGSLGVADAAQAKTRAPTLIGLRCVPKTTPGCAAGVRLAAGRTLQLRGQRLKRGMRVSFRWSRGALAAKLVLNRTGWTTRIPAGTAPGTVRVTVTDRVGRRSNARTFTVIAPSPVLAPASVPGNAPPAAFAGNGMWIWNLDQSDRGDVPTLAARAKAAGVTTVFVKSADGATSWAQFSPDLVNALHAAGLRACAWQFVYGGDPAGEAAAAAASVAAGADCFVIDAESQYEGRYASAQTYMAALRAAVGSTFPVGLTSFPYVDYHPKLPYSVFLGPGGAQVNLPQVYWKDIGGSVDAVSAKTVANNRIYGVPIAPLGQTYGSPEPDDLRRFRALWAGYGSRGLSWWSWQATPNALWNVLGEPSPAAAVSPDPGWPALAKGSAGDQVIWLQRHLASFDASVTATGKIGAADAAALAAFQTARGLPPTGETDAATWQALLTLPLAPVDWTAAA